MCSEHAGSFWSLARHTFPDFHCIFPCASQTPLPIQLRFAALCGGTRGSGSHTHQPLCPPAVLLQLGRDGLQGGLWVAERDSTQGSWSSKLHLHLNSSAPPYAGYSTFQTNFQGKAHKRVCHKLAFFAVQEKVCTIFWLHVHRDSTRAEQACSQ